VAETEEPFIIDPVVVTPMKPWSSAVIGLGIGALLGYAFGVRRGDPWMAGSIAVTSAIAGYGYLAYPQYRTRWSGPHSKLWYTLVGVLAPALMLITPESPLLTDDLSVVVLLGALWLGGVYAGVALAHGSPEDTDGEARSAPRGSPSD
jgi:hypothetical protein